LGKNKEVLYIGKATSLKSRVRSYFALDLMATRGPKLVKMIESFDSIDFQKTDSVLEALILEAKLIKKYQPPYNTKDKDNKSFNYVVITKEDFPKVMLARGRDLEMSKMPFDTDAKMSKGTFDMKIAYQFGPFPQGTAISDGLVLIRKIFPFRDEKCVPLSGRPCFNYEIGLCPGTCVGKVTKEEYKKTIRNIVDFFDGNKKKIIKNLEKQMKDFAKAKEFEKAGEAKRQIFALNHIHDISLIKQENITEKTDLVFRVEAYDIAHTAGRDVVGVMTVLENSVPQKSEYRKFKIKGDLSKKNSSQPGNNDPASLKQVLERRLNHEEWRYPNLIVVDGGVSQRNAAESVLEKLQLDIPVVAVTKDEHHRPKNILGDRHLLIHESDILLANAESHRYGIAYHKKLRDNLFK
jgi:excinuclease ABC subunit C